MPQRNRISKSASVAVLILAFFANASNTTSASNSTAQVESPQQTPPITGHRVAENETPEGLSREDWNDIRKQVRAAQYHARDDGVGGYVAENQAHGWNVGFTSEGTTTLRPRPKQGRAYLVGLRLESYGYDAPKNLKEPARVSGNGNVVTYSWDDNLTEWWVNDANGVEQWFGLKRRPEASPAGTPLLISMSLVTDLESTSNRNRIKLSGAASSAITYSKLKVWDTAGKVLPASLHFAEEQLQIRIDDTDAVYPLTVDPVWVHEAYLKASNTDTLDYFGHSVAIDGETVVVGAHGEASSATGVNGDQSDNSSRFAGAAYVFVRSDGQWNQQAYLKASNAEEGDLFGEAVAISGNTIVIGALNEDSGATGVNGDQNGNSVSYAGAAYVFVRSDDQWSQQAYLKASNTESRDSFGRSVAIDGDTLVVGAIAEDSSATGVNGDQSDNSSENAGAAYVFVRSDSQWIQQAYLKASNTDAFDLFGASVDISGDTLVVGTGSISIASDSEDSSATGVDGDQDDNSASNSGAAYVFTRSDGQWTQQAYLKASNTDGGDVFGFSVAVDGDTIAVGAPNEDSSSTGVNGDQENDEFDPLVRSGAVYVFARENGTWSQQAYIKASNTGSDDHFGSSIDISGQSLLVGAVLWPMATPFGEDSGATGVNGDQADDSAPESGAAYAFIRENGVWRQVAYLKASNTDEGDAFGYSVAIAGGTAVVGARSEDGNATGVNGNQDDNSAEFSGAAYVFNFATGSIGGTVSGLQGSGLVLQNNAADDLPVSTNGTFTFNTPLEAGDDYHVTVLTKPQNPSQTCTVSNGTGTSTGEDVTNVLVDCVTDTFTVGGAVSGLSAAGLVLRNNGTDDLPIGENGPFTFPTALEDLSDYSVTIASQPVSPPMNCAVNNGSGVLVSNNVTDVEVACIPVPIGASASDGLFPDHVAVSWQPLGSETRFEVYRCMDLELGDCVQIADVPAGTSSIEDPGASANGSVQYYVIRSCNEVGCSAYGAPDAGNRLGYPQSLTATDGDFLDIVRLNWSDTIGETYFEIYFCVTAETGSCGLPIKTVPANTVTYDDTLASADGTVLYYRLKACNDNGCGDFSATDAGNRLSKPGFVSASDGFFEDRVRIIWSDVIGETRYEVYRCADESTTSCGAAIASTLSDITAFDDLDASDDGTVYYYRLKACNVNGCTDLTDADAGSRIPTAEVIFEDGFESQ